MAKHLHGTVTSDKADKTIVISVRERRTHPIYKKQYTVNTKFMAHDAKNEAKTGDLVVIVETKPQSARKRFELQKILERAGARFEETDATADIPEEEPVPAPQPATSVKKAEPKPKAGEK
ncbi:MAG: 30S ribosomal protein S17 [Candidatus Saccharimonadales bacterium]